MRKSYFLAVPSPAAAASRGTPQGFKTWLAAAAAAPLVSLADNGACVLPGFGIGHTRQSLSVGTSCARSSTCPQKTKSTIG